MMWKLKYKLCANGSVFLKCNYLRITILKVIGDKMMVAQNKTSESFMQRDDKLLITFFTSNHIFMGGNK